MNLTNIVNGCDSIVNISARREVELSNKNMRFLSDWKHIRGIIQTISTICNFVIRYFTDSVRDCLHGEGKRELSQPQLNLNCSWE